VGGLPTTEFARFSRAFYVSQRQQSTTVAAQFLTIQDFSRKCPIGHALDISFENWTSSCRFAYSVSSDDPLTSSDASCLTRRHLASVLYSCHFFRTTRICPCDGYTCCSCRRAYAWSSRILIVTVTVRTPRCQQLTPIAGTTWLPSTPMRSYASPAL
jgi:hypothetical protein